MIGFPQQDVQVPTPETTESFERFAIRAHRVLIASGLKDPDERNELIERVWTQHNGELDAEREAKRRFSPSQFEIKKNVCVFAEHETDDEHGRTRRYGVKDLAKIVRDCNHRIAERGAFPAIADGHTPSDEGKPQPDVLGYHGTYRLGMIGQKKPIWAIFADEYHLKDKADVLRRKPRRSVELWTIKKSGEQFFDPVAALGSEAPRLPLPIKFQTVNSNGAVVERYSYQSETIADKGAEPMMADEDLRQLMAAVAQTPEFVWLRQKMQQEEAELNNPGEEELGGQELAAEQQVGEDPYGEMSPGSEPAGEMAPRVGDEPMGMDDFGQPQLGEQGLGPMAEAGPGGEYPGNGLGQPSHAPPASAGMDPMAPPASAKPQLYAPDQAPPMADDLMSDLDDVLGVQPPQAARQPGKKPPPADEQEYGMRYRHSLADSPSQIVHDNHLLANRVVQLEQQNADSDRLRRLSDMAHRYPGLIDADEEARVCLYSMGANISNAAFDKHLSTIERFARRAAPQMAERIPIGVLPESPDTKYSAAISREIRRLSDHYATHGEFRDYDSLVVEAQHNLR